jgi:hypothetical protein
LKIFEFSRKQSAAILAALVVKTLLTVFVFPVSPQSDFGSWVYGAESIMSWIQSGRIPAMDVFSVYLGQVGFLAPFFAVWQALPIAHPTITRALSQPYSAEGYLLIFLMKSPIILFDFFAGVLVSLIARASTAKPIALKAFFVWYLNPYPTYLMEYQGTYDIVSTVFVLLSLLLAMRKRPITAGLSISIATLMRLYPALALPALVLYALMKQSKRAALVLSASFFGPILSALFVEMLSLGSFAALVTTLGKITTISPWLLDFAGMPIIPFLTLTPFLIVVQVYLAGRFWRGEMLSATNLLLSSLLVLLVASYHHSYHLIWLLPLLTVYYVASDDSTVLFALFFVTAYLYELGYNAPSSNLLTRLQPLFAGLFVGVKASYLLKLNIHAIVPKIAATNQFKATRSAVSQKFFRLGKSLDVQKRLLFSRPNRKQPTLKAWS